MEPMKIPSCTNQEKAMEICDQKTLINMLNQGKELANQLKNHFESPIKSGQACGILVQKILSSYEKALSMLKFNALVEESMPVNSILESPQSLAGDSPKSANFDQDYSKNQCQKNVFKKRKTMARWSEQVRVCLGSGLEGPLADGYSWRKYGQKDILGASFPRAYYRCTHRHSQGCLATKHVQKSDEDPSIFEVTHRGRHTCVQTSQLATSLIPLGKEGKTQNQENFPSQQEGGIQKRREEIFLDFEAGLKTEEFGTSTEGFLPSFSFPSTPVSSQDMENHLLPEDLRENNFVGSYSPPFISPTASDSNYFSLSPCHMDSFGIVQSLQSSESDFTGKISTPTSVNNSPIGEFETSLDQVIFGSNFPFDIPELFT